MRGGCQGGHIRVQCWSGELGPASSPTGFLGTFNVTALQAGLENADTSSLFRLAFLPQGGPHQAHSSPGSPGGRAGQDLPSRGPGSHPRGPPACSLAPRGHPRGGLPPETQPTYIREKKNHTQPDTLKNVLPSTRFLISYSYVCHCNRF